MTYKKVICPAKVLLRQQKLVLPCLKKSTLLTLKALSESTLLIPSILLVKKFNSRLLISLKADLTTSITILLEMPVNRNSNNNGTG